MTIIFLTGGALLVLSSLYMLIPLLNTLSLALHSSLPMTSYVNTGFSLFYALGFLIVGAVAPKYGTKKTIVCGLFLLAVVTFITGFAWSIEVLIALRVLQGFVAATFAPTALTYIADNYPSRERIVVMSWVTTGFISAGVIGQIISSALERYWGWQGVFWIMAMVYLILSLMGVRVLTADSAPGSPNNEGISRVLKRLLVNPSLVKAYIVAFTLLLAFVALYSSLDNYLSLRFNLTRQEIFYIRASGMMGLAGAISVPRLAARFSFDKLVVLGLLIMIISLIPTVVASSPALIQAALVLFVAGLLITIPCIITLIGQLAGNDRGHALTWYSFILFVGAGVGPVVANGGNFATVIAILIAFLSIALGIALKINFTETASVNNG